MASISYPLIGSQSPTPAFPYTSFLYPSFPCPSFLCPSFPYPSFPCPSFRCSQSIFSCPSFPCPLFLCPHALMPSCPHFSLSQFPKHPSLTSFFSLISHPLSSFLNPPSLALCQHWDSTLKGCNHSNETPQNLVLNQQRDSTHETSTTVSPNRTLF